jgi:ribosome-associated protein
MTIPIAPKLAIDERALTEHFVRASGPGGQNVNKVSTAVELRLDIARAGLPIEIEERLRQLAASRITTEGQLIVEAREHRTQGANREAARARLIALIARAAVRPRTRRATKPSPASRVKRLTTKTRTSARKAARRSPGEDD